MGCQGSRDLSAFFDPRSIAVVGASDDPGKWGHGIARAALSSSADRPVHLVNQSKAHVLGRPAFASVSAIPGGADLVVVCVPVAAVASVVDDALAAGARGILAITSGLGESDEQGQQLQAALVERIRSSGAAMIGPNCLGLVDNASGVRLAAGLFPAGDVALLSQSGNLALELQRWFADERLGFSRFVSIGNQADVTLVDLLDACVDDPRTRAVAVYAEDVGDGRGFVAAAQRVRAAGKPVVLLTAGAGEAARRSARSHTGALTSAHDVIVASCEFSGAWLVESPRAMAQTLRALAHPARRTGTRIGIVTDGGGHGTLAASALEQAGLEVPELAARSQRDLAAGLWPQSEVANPVDLAGYGEQDVSSYARVVAHLRADSAIDAVLMTGYFGGYASADAFAGGLDRAEVEAAHEIVADVRRGGVPVVVQSMSGPSASLDVLRAGGIPVFAAVEDAVAALVRLGEPTTRPLPELPAPVGVQHHDYAGLKAVIREAGVPVATSIEVGSQPAVLAAAGTLPAPYVLKALGLLHKSDEGGVVLGIPDADALLDQYDRLVARFPGASIVVEPMVDRSAGVELLVGVVRDPRFGAVLTVGAGGTLAEVLQDTAVTLAPVDVGAARELLGRLRLAPLLTGFRGSPALALDAAADAVARLSSLGAAVADWAEFEVNPMLVTVDGVVVLDARAVPVGVPESA